MTKTNIPKKRYDLSVFIFIIMLFMLNYLKSAISRSCHESPLGMVKSVLHLTSRLGRRAQESFFGRQKELDSLLQALESDGHLVSYIHGPPGIGKTSIMAQFTHWGRHGGATVLTLDCRLIEPTPQGFLDAWGQLQDTNLNDKFSAAQAITQSGTMNVLCLDHYDSFRLLDTWLHQNLMPAMSDNFRIIMASSRPPVPRWLTSPSWHGLIRVLALTPLDKAAARELLTQAKVPAEQHDTITNRTHGNSDWQHLN